MDKALETIKQYKKQLRIGGVVDSVCLECQDLVEQGDNICPPCYKNGAHL